MDKDIEEIINLIKSERPNDYNKLSGNDTLWKTLIDRFGFENVLLAAMQLNILIARCRFNLKHHNHKEFLYRLGGVWNEPISASIIMALSRYNDMTDGICPACRLLQDNEANEEHARRKKR